MTVLLAILAELAGIPAGNIRSPVTTHNNYAWCIYVDGDVDFSYYGTEWNSCGALRILQVLVTEVLI